MLKDFYSFLSQAVKIKLSMAIRQNADVSSHFVVCLRSIHAGNFISYLALSLRLFSRDMLVLGESGSLS